ncbi:hypothetical protein BGZ54_002437 [Gamsiella multidivaricata]|nr:hypothetical protein BGZ54_002437 [Gamsiella multidivaricata]
MDPSQPKQDPLTYQSVTHAVAQTRSSSISTASSTPQTSFAPGFTPSLISSPATPPSPLTREENKARQRRVSSVSSSHSIRQIGTYGGSNMNPNKMISPSRKANPYYSGAIARFGNGGKHSLHDRDLSSSSGKRRSLVSVGGERAKVGAEATSSREKLSAAEQANAAPDKTSRASTASTASSLVSDTRDRTGRHMVRRSSNSASSPNSGPMLNSAYNEECGMERDENAKDRAQAPPFGTLSRNKFTESPPAIENDHDDRTHSRNPTNPAISNYPAESKAYQVNEDQRHPERPDPRIGVSSSGSVWSRTTGMPSEIGNIPDSMSNITRTESAYSRALTSLESQDSDSDGEATPSVSTLSSAQMVRDYREQGIITTHEDWDDSESLQEDAPPVVMAQRTSMDVPILPDQPQSTQSTRRLSIGSSVLSASSNKHPQLHQHHPKRFTSVAQWSESSYDPCAPLRWDELFEMDPNSRGPLWLSNRGLGQIPHEFFDGLRNLRELYLDHNDIKVVPDSILKLTKLDVLDLSCNSISSFHSAFKLKKLKNLRRLNLDHNMLTDISPIYKLKALRELRMNHNFVPYLAIAIQNMTKLKILAMESNSLATLPETMGKLGNLCELRLSDNNLRTLPSSIGSIRTLQVLALRSNLLEKLPESWKDMENLSTLDLACNRLTFLPADIVRLPKLTHLDLHDNQIQALPEKIGQLSNLVVLQLCNNHLRELPKDIGRLRDLHDLVLSFNQLQWLPDEIGKLNKLQELKFDNNPLRSLPRTIQRLTNVRRVHLQGCELHDLPVELGIAFKDLVYLDLSGNQFEVMPALDQMTKLEEFYISNNFLREIGISSLNLSNSNSVSNSYSGITSGSIGSGAGFTGHAHSGSGSMSLSGQTGSATVNTGNSTGNPSAGQAAVSTGLGSSMMGGGVTASKLSELKRLRVFEAHDNQIRVLSPKIKMIPGLEVLNLGNNFLSWLPKEVGDLADLKVLILEGNPIKSLPSSLTKLMGSLEVFRIGEWPENGFEITRTQMSMKINVLQSFMPQQIERTLLLRMHDSILKRVQELDSEQYRDQQEMDRNRGAGTASRLLVTSPPRLSGSATLQPARRGSVTQGLAIASHNMMINRSFALPSMSSGNDGPSSDQAMASLLTVNSEGINPNYVERPSAFGNVPSLYLPGIRGHSASVTAFPLTTSPQSTTASSGPMSSFPLLNSLRSRKSQQQLSTKSRISTRSRPKTIYTFSDPQQQEVLQQEEQQFSSNRSNRISRVFDFASGSRQRHDESTSRVATLESSSLQLSTDAMSALGLRTQPGFAGSVIVHSNDVDRLGYGLTYGDLMLGDGSLANIRSSMAIKSSPSLTSTPLSLFSSRPSSPVPTGSGSDSRPPVILAPRTSLGRSISPQPAHASEPLKRSLSTIGNTSAGQDSEKSTTALPWLRLKPSTAPFSPTQDNAHQRLSDYPAASSSIASTATSMSTSSLLLQPRVNGLSISAPTPPPILLDYDLDTSHLDIPPHMYYSAGGDDVDGDHPDQDGASQARDGETEDDDQSTTTGGDGPSARRKGKAHFEYPDPRPSQEMDQQQQYRFSHQLSATDPVLKIAVLKGIYDQILQNMDQLVEQNVQESPAKKNNRFKLLNTLRFLKADRTPLL